MQLTINLPERETTLTATRRRWAEVLLDPAWSDHFGRIETNAFGQIIMNPPPGFRHAKWEAKIANHLSRLLGGQAATECPVSTVDGVKGADVAWYSDQRNQQVQHQDLPDLAPEICVEVLSPSNTDAEMQHKRMLYFDAGATECWICDLQGRMTYYTADDPNTPKIVSELCPDFPTEISD